MKKLLIIATLMVSNFASALVADVDVSKAIVDLARVETVKTLKEPNINDNIKLQLVQLDNGGSTDISSYIDPSSLYLTVYVQDEEYDLSAKYQLFNSMIDIVSAKYDEKSNTMTVVTNHRKYDVDATNGSIFEMQNHTVIYLDDLMKEIVSGKEELTATIGVQTAQF